jgi:hypothetical protein
LRNSSQKTEIWVDNKDADKAIELFTVPLVSFAQVGGCSYFLGFSWHFLLEMRFLSMALTGK